MSRFSFPAVLAALLLVSAAPEAQSQPAESADTLFAKGVERHQKGDILGAVEAYSDALAQDPGRVDARSNLGAAYVRLGRYEDAVAQYRKALETDPSLGAVRFNLALALYKSAQIGEAARELETVLSKDAQNRSAVLLLADCRLQMGQSAQVVSLLQPRDGEMGDDRLYNYLLGTALLDRNELLAGQKRIDQLFRRGETAEGHLLLGVAQMARHDAKNALLELERAIELNPKLPTLQSLYGRALMERGRRVEALAAFRNEFASNPNDFDANLYLGLLLKDENRLDEANDHLRRAARLRAQDVRVQYGLGSLHLAAGRVDEAQKALETVVVDAPEYTQAHVLLATVYYRQKKKDLGDRERAIAEKLKEKKQAAEPGSQDELGPAYKGDETPAPAAEKRKEGPAGEGTP